MMLEKKLELKNICLKNRIVMPPMAREASIEGKPSDELIDYYKKRAEYTGLIITEHAYISLEGKSSQRQLSMADDSVIEPQSIAYDKSSINNMTKEDIEKVKNDFINASIRTKKAGFDGVEIHAAHEYLLNHFYSPLTNKRTDEYGGNLENRLRLANEIIQEVRRSVGEGKGEAN